MFVPNFVHFRETKGLFFCCRNVNFSHWNKMGHLPWQRRANHDIGVIDFFNQGNFLNVVNFCTFLQ